MTSKKKILISGWYGYGNAGDEAILHSFIHEMGGLADISILTTKPEMVSQDYPAHGVVAHPQLLGKGIVRPLFNGGLARYLRKLRDTDLLVFGGGGVVKESVDWRTMGINLDDIWLAKWFRKPIALYALGVSPLTSPLKRWVYRQTFRRCDLICVRDTGGANVLKGLGIAAERIITVADPVFALEPRPPIMTTELDEIVRGAAAGEYFALSIGLALKQGKGDSNIKALAEVLDRLYDQHGARFYSLPMRVLHDEFDDRRMAAGVRQYMRHPENLRSFEQALEPEQLMWLMGHFRFCIAARLHAAIFCLARHVPVVAINCDRYDPKVRVILEDAGFGDWVVDADAQFVDSLFEQASKSITDLSGCRARIEARLPAIIAKAKVFFDKAKTLISR